ncbi:head maturation protease, ClpP-related [uncultured Acidaminococcus sp.]|uniref:head maturation protease, ClpP-related n=1 Tax=uncultured Acidaminococcus sp. TaxID=352152 RepID=UPI002666A7AC|nr:head maturation protease, ClpP-related [uncultured Acidaminococcus sp.]
MTRKLDFWTIKNEADSQEAELLIYGEISPNAEFWHAFLPDDPMVSAKELQKDLRDLGGKDLTLRINSPGGDVFQAQAIYNLLKAYTGKIHCHIDGICASAATLVASAADDVIMPANALYMIHNPMMCFGYQTLTRDDLAKCIEQMDKTKDTLLNVYSDRCGDSLTRDEIARMMDEETWMTAQEALDNGFVDGVDDYGVSASMSGGGVMVNHVLMTSLDPSKVQALKQLCEKNEVKKPMTTTNDAGIMDRLKAFLDGQDKKAEAAQKAAAEADRVKALDALKGDNPMVNALVDTGKANGATAEQLKPYVDAVAAVKVENKSLDELKALITDQMQSGAAGVKANVTEPVSVADDSKAEVDNIVNLVNKKRG